MKNTKDNQYGIIQLIILIVIVFVVAGGWWWVKHHKSVDSFETCTKSGSSVQLSYPEVCITKDGKRFVQSLAK